MRAFPYRVSVFVGRFMAGALILSLSAAAVLAQAQASTADLSGTVADPNGAVVAGATVTARNEATGLSRSVTSDSNGTYQLIGLPPGEYEVTAEAATFKRVVVSGVRLTVGQSANPGRSGVRCHVRLSKVSMQTRWRCAH